MTTRLTLAFLTTLAAFLGLTPDIAGQSPQVWFAGTARLVDDGRYGFGDTPYGVVVADFNRDGKLDFATANYYTNNVAILLGNGDGSFGPFTASSFIATGTAPRWIASADFNGDGNLDLVAANNAAHTVSILPGHGDGTFGTKSDYDVGMSPEGVATGDFNHDGIPDLVTANANSRNVSVLLGQAGRGFAAHADFPTADRPSQIRVGDFNGDGHEDLAVTCTSPLGVSILLGNGAGGFGNHADFATGTGPSSLALSDFNRDGVLDLATTGERSRVAAVLFGKGDGTFGGRVALVPVAGTPLQVAAEDFTGDGNPDALLASARDGCAGLFCPARLTFYVGNGDGTFRGPFGVGPGSAATGMEAGDFNADGRMDVAVADGMNDAVAVLLQSAPLAAIDFAVTTTCRGGKPRCANDSMATVTAGESISFTITATPLPAPPYPNALTLACGSLPPAASCAFAPTTLDLSTGPQSAVLTIRTSSASAPLLQPLGPRQGALQHGMELSLLPLAFVGLRGTRRRRRRPRSLRLAEFLWVLLLLGGALLACGDVSSATPPGNYAVVVATEDGSVLRTLDIALVVR